MISICFLFYAFVFKRICVKRIAVEIIQWEDWVQTVNPDLIGIRVGQHTSAVLQDTNQHGFGNTARLG